jgi:hypothetical protein
LYPSPNKPALLTAQSRVDIALQEEVDIDRFVKNTVRSLKLAVDEVRKSDPHHPEHIQLALSAPWYITQTRTIRYSRATVFTCTKKLIDDLVEKEIAYVFAHDMDRFGEYGKDATLIDRQISAVTLNGYQTASPYGKKAHTMEIHIMITLAPQSIIKQFTDVIHHTYGARRLSITTSPFAAFVVARDLLAAPDDFIVLDVGEEITDVTFIKEQVILYQHSFPVGTHELYRHIAATGRYTILEARGLVESYSTGVLSGKPKAVLEAALSLFIQQWQKALQQVLDQGQFGFCLPSHIYLMADPRFEQLFTVTVKDDPYIKHICIRGIIHPQSINSVLLGAQVHASHGSIDGILGVATLFVGRYL